jgi:hypothetical protein
MSPSREFGAALRESRGEPITFKFAGTGPWRCVRALPWSFFEDMLALQRAGDDEGIALKIGPFFRTVVVPEQREAFERDVLDQLMTPGAQEVIVEVVSWLIEQYTGRPTERPSASPPTQPSAGERSRVVSLSRGTVETVDSIPEPGPPEVS